MRIRQGLIGVLITQIVCLAPGRASAAGAPEATTNAVQQEAATNSPPQTAATDAAGKDAARPSVVPLPPFPSEGKIVKAVFSRYPDVDQKEVMVFIGRELPEDRQRFTLLAMRNEPEASAFLAGLVRQALDLIVLQETRPDVYEKTLKQRKLDRRAAELGGMLRRAQPAQKEPILKQLRQLLAESFEIKQELMRRDVSQMELQLGELKQLLARREENRRAIVEARVGELTGEKEALEW